MFGPCLGIRCKVGINTYHLLKDLPFPFDLKCCLYNILKLHVCLHLFIDFCILFIDCLFKCQYLPVSIILAFLSFFLFFSSSFPTMFARVPLLPQALCFLQVPSSTLREAIPRELHPRPHTHTHTHTAMMLLCISSSRALESFPSHQSSCPGFPLESSCLSPQTSPLPTTYLSFLYYEKPLPSLATFSI